MREFPSSAGEGSGAPPPATAELIICVYVLLVHCCNAVEGDDTTVALSAIDFYF